MVLTPVARSNAWLIFPAVSAISLLCGMGIGYTIGITSESCYCAMGMNAGNDPTQLEQRRYMNMNANRDAAASVDTSFAVALRDEHHQRDGVAVSSSLLGKQTATLRGGGGGGGGGGDEEEEVAEAAVVVEEDGGSKCDVNKILDVYCECDDDCAEEEETEGDEKQAAILRPSSSSSGAAAKKSGWGNIATIPREALDAAVGVNEFGAPHPSKSDPEMVTVLNRAAVEMDPNADPLRSCKSLDVVHTKVGKEQCLAIIEHAEPPSRHVSMRIRNGDSKSSNSKWTPTTRVQQTWLKEKLPSAAQKAQHMKLLEPLLMSAGDMRKELSPVLKARARENTVIVMVVNRGALTVLFNFVCSARNAGVEITNLLVFAADEETASALATTGGDIAYIAHSAWTDHMPKKSAGAYGDATFMSMMWMKTAAVWLVHGMGYNVLFQDADVVWFRDPIPELVGRAERSDLDSLWMDDGNHDARYGPYFANTGFYFLRCTAETGRLLQELLFSYDLMLSWQSHQAVVCQFLEEHNSRHGHNVAVLDREWAAGGYFAVKPNWGEMKFMQDWSAGRRESPAVFHMHWTGNTQDKLRLFHENNMWWIADETCEVGEFGSGASCCVAHDGLPPSDHWSGEKFQSRFPNYKMKNKR